MSKPSVRGRQSKLTSAVQEKIVAAIRAGNYSIVAAQYAGIGERTFYRWLQRGRDARSGVYREFYDAVELAEREAEVRAVAIIQQHMSENWQAAMTFLARRYPERWGRRDRLSVDVNPKEVLCELLAISPEELEEAVDEVARL